MHKIILASGSEGRRSLFEKYYPHQFDVVISGVEEDDLLHLPPKEMVEALSLRKAMFLAPTYPDHIICAFDTTVSCAGKTLGKPQTINEARDMLQFLNGKSQTVWSGYTIIYNDFQESGVDMATLQFKMSNEHIEEYIHKYPVTKFAGAYAIQKEDAHITISSGSMETIIGAPMEIVTKIIQQI